MNIVFILKALQYFTFCRIPIRVWCSAESVGTSRTFVLPLLFPNIAEHEFEAGTKWRLSYRETCSWFYWYKNLRHLMTCYSPFRKGETWSIARPVRITYSSMCVCIIEFSFIRHWREVCRTNGVVGSSNILQAGKPRLRSRMKSPDPSSSITRPWTRLSLWQKWLRLKGDGW
jgi:hypothetical protein